MTTAEFGWTMIFLGMITGVITIGIMLYSLIVEIKNKYK